jgi:hypothetical protein
VGCITMVGTTVFSLVKRWYIHGWDYQRMNGLTMVRTIYIPEGKRFHHVGL